MRTKHLVTGLNILIVEDNIGDARLIAEMLKESGFDKYEATYISDYHELTEIEANHFHVVLLDLHLSDLPPIETFKMFHAAFPKKPIIVLTGLDDDALAAKVVRMGAQDYLVKGTFGAGTLKRSIMYSIERKKSQMRILRMERRSRKLQLNSDKLKSETVRLKDLNKAKDVFLSIASHQLRTPATAVKQYIGMLLEGFGGETTKQQQHFLTTAYQSNERQLKIVNDLLKVAKLDAGHITLSKSITDINALITTILEDQASTFKLRGQKIIFTPVTPNVEVNIDAANFRMVVENILDNASKYSPVSSEIFVSIALSKNIVRITIQDKGMGISKVDQKKMFKKFSRADSSFIVEPDGSGLGLYWAQEIIKLHDGEILLDSKLKKGSTFTICIPA